MDKEPIKPDEEYHADEQEHEIFQTEPERSKLVDKSQVKRVLIIIVILVLIICLYKLYGLFSATPNKNVMAPTTSTEANIPSVPSPASTTAAVPANMPVAPSPTAVPPAVTPAAISSAIPAAPQVTAEVAPTVPAVSPTVSPIAPAARAPVTSATSTRSTTSSTSTTPVNVSAGPTTLELTQNNRLNVLEQGMKNNYIAIQTMQNQISSLAASMSKMENSLNAMNASIQGLRIQPTVQPTVIVKTAIIKQKRRIVQRNAFRVAGYNQTAGMMMARMRVPLYYIKAMIQGRAWLISANGRTTLTVSSGDHLPGYGMVEQIDPYQGTITTGSGVTIQYNPADR